MEGVAVLSPDGKYIYVSTQYNQIYVYDSFSAPQFIIDLPEGVKSNSEAELAFAKDKNMVVIDYSNAI